jgi:hypothetical protein
MSANSVLFPMIRRQLQVDPSERPSARTLQQELTELQQQVPGSTQVEVALMKTSSAFSFGAGAAPAANGVSAVGADSSGSSDGGGLGGMFSRAKSMGAGLMKSAQDKGSKLMQAVVTDKKSVRMHGGEYGALPSLAANFP